MWLFFLGFFRRAWKPILAIMVLLTVIGMIYYKGVRDTRLKDVKDDLKKTISKINRERAIETKAKKIKEKIQKARKETPRNDKRDSCLLSHSHREAEKCLD